MQKLVNLFAVIYFISIEHRTKYKRKNCKWQITFFVWRRWKILVGISEKYDDFHQIRRYKDEETQARMKRNSRQEKNTQKMMKNLKSKAKKNWEKIEIVERNT